MYQPAASLLARVKRAFTYHKPKEIRGEAGEFALVHPHRAPPRRRLPSGESRVSHVDDSSRTNCTLCGSAVYENRWN
jgi:hypothetical protein